jgi:CDP-diacylglycerol--glycerol-3-phosphate 3-phosphatidyltransferase
LLWYILGTDDWKLGALLVLFSATGAVMVSYARARAEAAGWKASVGILARPERVVVLSLGLIIDRPMWALIILAVATNLTAVIRMAHVWREAQKDGNPA